MCSCSTSPSSTSTSHPLPCFFFFVFFAAHADTRQLGLLTLTGVRNRHLRSNRWDARRSPCHPLAFFFFFTHAFNPLPLPPPSPPVTPFWNNNIMCCCFSKCVRCRGEKEESFSFTVLIFWQSAVHSGAGGDLGVYSCWSQICFCWSQGKSNFYIKAAVSNISSGGKINSLFFEESLPT